MEAWGDIESEAGLYDLVATAVLLFLGAQGLP